MAMLYGRPYESRQGLDGTHPYVEIASCQAPLSKLLNGEPRLVLETYC
jgi:hypothetical protein